MMSDPVINDEMAQLRAARRQVAHACITAPPAQLPAMFAGEIGQVHRALLASNLKYEPLTADERRFAQSMTKGEVTHAPAISLFAAMMLYYPAGRLPSPALLNSIPPWLCESFFFHLLDVPIFLRDAGDADASAQQLARCINEIGRGWEDHPADPQWHHVALELVNRVNCIPFYLTDLNVRNAMVQRGRTFERALRERGHLLDWRFPPRPSHRCIRIGILARNFAAGTETAAALPLFEYLPDDYEVLLYAQEQVGDAMEQYCASRASASNLLQGDFASQVSQIRTDDLDILIVATNVTAALSSAALLAAHRLARVQITSTACVITTGLSNIDYFLSGELTDAAPDAQEHYSERLWRIPGSAHCFSHPLPPASPLRPQQRTEFDIPSDAFVFVSGATAIKITPELAHAWASILSAVPHSVLMLFPFGPSWGAPYPRQQFRSHLSRVLAEHGINDPRRPRIIDVQPTPDRWQIRAAMAAGDVYLDSFPMAGTTSLVEPLEAGLPVVSRRGQTFRSAMGAAMLQSMGLRELIAEDEKQYIRLAIALGNDKAFHNRMADLTRAAVSAGPAVLDSRQHAKRVSVAYREMLNSTVASPNPK